MLNQNQDILPYAYNMQQDLPKSSGVPNAAIPSLAPSMMNPLINAQSFMPSQNQPGYAHGGLVRYIQSMQDSRFTQPHSQFAHGGLAHLIRLHNIMQSMQDSRFTQPHSQYAGGGQVLNQSGGVTGLTHMAQMAEQLRAAGDEDGDSILAHINPMEAQMLGQMSGGPSVNPHTNLPSYKFRPFKIVKGLVKAAAPILGAVIGGTLGGPGGAALGGALGAAAVSKKKNRLANAALGGLGGYVGAGGFGALGGAGKLIPTAGKTLASTLGIGGKAAAMHGAGMAGAGGAGAAGAGGILGAGGPFGQYGQYVVPALGLGAVLGTAGRKVKHPDESQALEEHITHRPKWGPEHQTRHTKPLNRKLRQLEEQENPGGVEQLYFEDVNPETEYMATGGYASPGYLHGATGGQDDKIKAELSDGEYVISADVVSRLGDGNNMHGAKRLDGFMRKVRTHTNSKDGKLSPKSKGIEYYLKAGRK